MPTLTLDLSEQEYKLLLAQSQDSGRSIEEVMRERIRETQGAATSPAIVFPPTGRAVNRLLARLQAEATDDPEEIRKAQEELDDMKRSMNAERIRSGAEPIF